MSELSPAAEAEAELLGTKIPERFPQWASAVSKTPSMDASTSAIGCPATSQAHRNAATGGVGPKRYYSLIDEEYAELEAETTALYAWFREAMRLHMDEFVSRHRSLSQRKRSILYDGSFEDRVLRMTLEDEEAEIGEWYSESVRVMVDEWDKSCHRIDRRKDLLRACNH